MQRLLHVETEDGLALAGALVAPDRDAKPLAVVFVHGNTGVFHEYPYVLLARALAARGWPVVLANTRGHGVTSAIWNLNEDQPVAGGSAWELLEDAPRDVAAWVDEADSVVAAGVVVLGHSQGAAKAVLYAAERADERLRGLVLASPDLHGHWSDVVDEAERLVTAGRGDELLPPLMGASWYRLSAANVVSRARVLGGIYAADEGAGAPPLAAVAVPLLALFAVRDVGGGPELATILANATAAPGVTTAVLAGGDHVYTDAEDEAADTIAGWLAGLA